jgi:hypothetical protein
MVNPAEEIDAIVAELEAAIKSKAPHGHACNRCGACCMVSVCLLGHHVFGINELGKCPALEHHGEEYRCGIIEHPERYTDRPMVEGMREAALILIGHDLGCDAAFPGEPRNQAYTMEVERNGKVTAKREAFVRARQLWGVKS